MQAYPSFDDVQHYEVSSDCMNWREISFVDTIGLFLQMASSYEGPPDGLAFKIIHMGIILKLSSRIFVRCLLKSPEQVLPPEILADICLTNSKRRIK